MAREMTPSKSLLWIAWLSVFTFLAPQPHLAHGESLSDYQFQDEDGNKIHLPDLPVYWKEKPGPWRGLETVHDPIVKARTKREGLEMTRVMRILVNHDKADGYIKAFYVLDKDKLIIGYHAFKENAGPAVETEIMITSVINYVEIYVECSKHGLWKKIYRFV